jgi:DNA-binding HxlR family transcriptional regulator
MPRVLVQARDLVVLKIAEALDGCTQRDLPWCSTYQSKMRRLRKLCGSGLLERRIEDRRKPNTYFLTEKGQRVLHSRQNLFSVERKV